MKQQKGVIFERLDVCKLFCSVILIQDNAEVLQRSRETFSGEKVHLIILSVLQILKDSYIDEC